MIDLLSLPIDSLSQTQRTFRDEFIKRGWEAKMPYQGSAHYFVTRDDGKKLHFFSSTPPTSSYAAASLANDKFGTYELLKEADIPQLETIKIQSHDTLEAAVAFMQNVGKVVVKPIDGGHGKGITTGITSEEELAKAIATAFTFTKYINAVLVQKQYLHDAIFELRVLCIDFKHTATLERVPARVFGDGIHTVADLIAIENQREDRGKAYKARLATIDREHALTYLKERAQTIPAKGEQVTVLGVANYGAGGEAIDATDRLPNWLVEYAEATARQSGLPVVGVDFMLSQPPEPHLSQDELDPIVIEINKAPLLSWHDTPTSGQGRPATAAYIDYLASL